MTFTPDKYGVISSGNSTSTPLTASSVFNGTSENVKDYTMLKLSINSDVSSAINGIEIQFSQDNSNWDDVGSFTYDVKENKTFYKEIEIKTQYFRIKYTNGTTNQTAFRLQVMYHTSEKKAYSELKDNEMIDGFGRMRVSNPETLISVHHVRDDNVHDVSELIAGGATSVRSAAYSAQTMTTASSGDQVIRQTRKRGLYQPGKNMVALITARIGSLTNTTAKIGAYDTNGGVYFKYGTDMELCIVNGLGSVKTITRSNWNINKADGSTGITVDFSKTLIYFIEWQWLGVGTVSFGVIVDEKKIYFHKEKHSNKSSLNGAYMKTGTLPIRWEIEQTGTGSGVLYAVCGMIMAEGSLPDSIGRQHSINRGTTLKALSSGSTVPIMAMKLKSGAENSICTVLFSNLNVICTTGGNILVEVYKFFDALPTAFLTNSSFNSAEFDSCVEYDIASTAITLTNGNKIASGYISSTQNSIDIKLSKQNVFLSSNHSAISDVIVVVCTSISPNESVLCSAIFEEFV